MILTGHNYGHLQFIFVSRSQDIGTSHNILNPMFLVWSMLHASIEGIYMKFNRPFTHLVRTKQTISSQHFWRLHPNLHSHYINICKISNFANGTYLPHLQCDAHGHLAQRNRNPRVVNETHLTIIPSCFLICRIQRLPLQIVITKISSTRIETY